MPLRTLPSSQLVRLVFPTSQVRSSREAGFIHRAAAGPGLPSASFRPGQRRSVGVKVLVAQGFMGMFWGAPRPQWGGGTQPFSSWYLWFPGATDEVGTQERRQVRAVWEMGEPGVAPRQGGQSDQEDEGEREMQRFLGAWDFVSGAGVGVDRLFPTWICYSTCGPCPVRISVLSRYAAREVRTVPEAKAQQGHQGRGGMPLGTETVGEGP